MTVNKAIIVGRLGKDPEIRQTQSGMAIGNLSLATSERVKKGDEWADHTEWHRVTVFGKNAENAGKFLSKGSQVYVEGKIRTRKWQDNNGNDKYTTEILADVVRYLSSNQNQGQQNQRLDNNQQRQRKPSPPSNAGGGGGGGWDADIPFSPF